MIIKCEYLPHQRQLPRSDSLKCNDSTASCDFFNWEVLSAHTKHLQMDLHKSSHVCHGCAPFREVVSDAPGRGSLWNTQVNARGEVKTFKYNQQTNKQKFIISFQTSFWKRGWCWASVCFLVPFPMRVALNHWDMCPLWPWPGPLRHFQKAIFLAEPHLRRSSLMNPSFTLPPCVSISSSPYNQSLFLISILSPSLIPAYLSCPLYTLPSI